MALGQVSLNRPNKLNALNMEMFRGIVRATKELQQDRDVAAVILRGEGRAFCAGLDFKNVLANPVSVSACMTLHCFCVHAKSVCQHRRLDR